MGKIEFVNKHMNQVSVEDVKISEKITDKEVIEAVELVVVTASLLEYAVKSEYLVREEKFSLFIELPPLDKNVEIDVIPGTSVSVPIPCYRLSIDSRRGDYFILPIKSKEIDYKNSFYVEEIHKYVDKRDDKTSRIENKNDLLKKLHNLLTIL